MKGPDGTNLVLESACLHQAERIPGAGVTEKTISKAKLPNSELFFDGQVGLWIVTKKGNKTSYDSIPNTAVSSYHWKAVDEKPVKS